MHILINKNYFFAFPKCSQQARTLMVLMAKQLYPNKLKFAKMIKTNKRLEVGVLTKRTI
jgi:hypothetical protein